MLFTCLLGVGVVSWSPLACGIITGKYENGISESSRASLKVLSCCWSIVSPDRWMKICRVKTVPDICKINKQNYLFGKNAEPEYNWGQRVVLTWFNISYSLNTEKIHLHKSKWLANTTNQPDSKLLSDFNITPFKHIGLMYRDWELWSSMPSVYRWHLHRSKITFSLAIHIHKLHLSAPALATGVTLASQSGQVCCVGLYQHLSCLRVVISVAEREDSEWGWQKAAGKAQGTDPHCWEAQLYASTACHR